jgi:enoyl-[acyl-carrier protein] reductase I
VGTALQTSAYSLAALSTGMMHLMKPGSSIVGLDFDARVAWPSYDWMGVAKAALESTSRYLARDLGEKGIRVNLVSAGPQKTLAAKGISGFEKIEGEWGRQAPLAWDTTDTEPAGRAIVSLLSDWWPATTGELIHVDGGYHAMGAPIK